MSKVVMEFDDFVNEMNESYNELMIETMYRSCIPYDKDFYGEERFYKLREIMHLYNTQYLNESLDEKVSAHDRNTINQKVKLLTKKLSYKQLQLEDLSEYDDNNEYVPKNSDITRVIFYWDKKKAETVLREHGYNIDNVVHFMLRKKGVFLEVLLDKSYETEKLLMNQYELDKIYRVCVDDKKRYETRYAMYVATEPHEIIKIIYTLRFHPVKLKLIIRIITAFDVSYNALPKEVKVSYRNNKRAIDMYTEDKYDPIGFKFVNLSENTIDIREEQNLKFRNRDTDEIKDFTKEQMDAMSTDEKLKWFGEDNAAARYCHKFSMFLLEGRYRDLDMHLYSKDIAPGAYYEGYYEGEVMDEAALARHKEYYDDNVTIFNECVAKLKNGKEIKLSLKYGELFAEAYCAVAYAHPQEEVREKMAAMFGDEVLDKLRE